MLASTQQLIYPQTHSKFYTVITHALIVPRNVQHDASTNSDGRELDDHVLELLGLVGASLEKLRDDGNGSNVEERTSSEGKKHVTPCLSSVSNWSLSQVIVELTRLVPQIPS